MTVPDETDAERTPVDVVHPTVNDVEGHGGDDPERTDVEADRSAVTVYRWACPVCGESRTGIASGTENPREKAAFSLRQHVRTSEDDVHGPANAFPPAFDHDDAGKAVWID